MAEQDDDLDDFDDDQLAALTAIRRLGDVVERIPWFSRIGQPLSAEERELAQRYLDMLGFPDAAPATAAAADGATIASPAPALLKSLTVAIGGESPPAALAWHQAEQEEDGDDEENGGGGRAPGASVWRPSPSDGVVLFP